MFYCQRCVCVIAVILSGPWLTAGAGEVRVRGRVLTPEGRPVQGAEAAIRWTRPEQRLEADGALVTTREGRFEGILRVPDDKPVALLVLDDSRQHGGVVVLQPRELSSPIEIVIRPVVTVRGSFDVSALPAAPEVIRLEVLAQPGNVGVVATEWKAGRFELRLPPASYELVAVSEAADPFRKSVELLPGGSEVGLGELALRPAQRQEGKERPPPWTVTEARGLSPDVKLSDLRGKWVLVDFWGFWCAPCVSKSLPRMIQFYEKHAAERDRFVLIAFHDASVKSLAEMDSQLQTRKIPQKFWGGKMLPFPVLLDSTGQTIKAWGIWAFPTEVLIDPEGNIVRRGTGLEQLLEQKLKESAGG